MRGPHSTRFSLVRTIVKMASAVMRLRRPKPRSIFPIRDRASHTRQTIETFKYTYFKNETNF